MKAKQLLGTGLDALEYLFSWKNTVRGANC